MMYGNMVRYFLLCPALPLHVYLLTLKKRDTATALPKLVNCFVALCDYLNHFSYDKANYLPYG